MSGAFSPPRRATRADIARLMEIRSSVRENRLVDPMSVTRADYEYFVDQNRVWVQEAAGQLIGFSASDGRDGTIWALFMDPAHEGQGVGSRLLALCCADLAFEGRTKAFLSTDAGTRAAVFYHRQGWVPIQPEAEGLAQREVHFKRDF